MKRSLLFSISFGALILFFTSAFMANSDNYFEIGSKQWNLKSGQIANESFDLNSKFGLDLIGEKTDSSKDNSLIWFSLTSTNTDKIKDGFYEFSSTPLNDRAPYSFNGSVKISDREFKITNGSFSIKTLEDSISVNFILELANGNIVNGKYNGKVSLADRSID